MIQLISATNEKDIAVGKYFKESQENLQGFLKENNLNDGYDNLDSDKCTHDYIDKQLPVLTKSLPFIFVVYTHGRPSAFTCNGLSYVDKENVNNFQGALVYSTACSAGKYLGQDLISAGCKAFIGFCEESNVFIDDDHRNISKNCDQSGLFQFLSSDKTLQECFEDMKGYYNSHIDKLTMSKDILYRAELLANREALTLLGDASITMSAFMIGIE